MPRRTPAFLVTSVLLAASAAAQDVPAPCLQNDLPSLRAAVTREPENVGLRLRVTQALLRPDKETAHPDVAEARLKEALSHLEHALKANPRAEVPLRFLALDAYKSGSLDRAIDLGRRLLEIDPTDAEVARTVLKALIRLERTVDATDFLVAWLERGTLPSFGALHGLLSSLVLNPAFREAFVPRIEAACKKCPQDPSLRLYRAVFLAESGRMESAWALLHEAERLGLCDIRTGARHTFVSTLKGKTPEIDETPASYDGLDLDEVQKRAAEAADHAGLAMRKGRLLDLGGRKGDALAAYAEVRRLNPSYWPAWFRTGDLLLKEGRAQEAADHFKRTRELFPAFLPAALLEADAASRSKQLDRAVALVLDVAPHFDPGKATRDVMGLLWNGDQGPALPKVVEGLRAALAAQPANPHLHAHLAMALFQSSKEEEARRTVILAERSGLAGRDGWPAALVFEVFRIKNPLDETEPPPGGDGR